MELGFAFASGIPIFSLRAPHDNTLCQYATVVESVREALLRVAEKPNTTTPNVLVDPASTIETAHTVLDDLLPNLVGTFRDQRLQPEERLVATRRFMQGSLRRAFLLASPLRPLASRWWRLTDS